MENGSLDSELLVLAEEVVRRIKNGSLDNPKGAREALGKMVSGFNPSPSHRSGFNVAPEDQTTTMKAFLELFGKGRRGYRPEDIPSAPDEGEGVMLVAHLPGRDGKTSVQRTFDAWLKFLVADLPAGFNFESHIATEPQYLKGLPWVSRAPGVYWVRCRRRSDLMGSPEFRFIDDLWKTPELRSSLAGTEALMELVHSRSLFAQGRVYLTGLQARRTQRDRWRRQTVFLEAQAPAKGILLRRVSVHGATLTRAPLMVAPLP